MIDNEPHFIGYDVATILGYSRPDNAIRNHVNEEDKLMHQVSASGQKRQMTVINESGVYDLIFDASRQGKNADIREQATKFRHWVTNDVLPSIRKTGSYQAKPLTAVEQIKLLPKAVVELDDRVTNLEENQVIPQPLYNALQHRISQRVSEIAFSYGGVNKKQRSELFKDINGGVKRIANVSARSMLREKHYQMVMDFVNAWEPSTATRTIIQQTALNVGEPA